MAELLVLAFDTSNPDPNLDLYAWKQGYIVDVKPDFWSWGGREGLPRFWKIKIPGVAVEKVRKWMDRPAKGLRSSKFSLSSLPEDLRAQLTTAGEITLKNIATLEGHMRVVNNG